MDAAHIHEIAVWIRTLSSLLRRIKFPKIVLLEVIRTVASVLGLVREVLEIIRRIKVVWRKIVEVVVEVHVVVHRELSSVTIKLLIVVEVWVHELTLWRMELVIILRKMHLLRAHLLEILRRVGFLLEVLSRVVALDLAEVNGFLIKVIKICDLFLRMRLFHRDVAFAGIRE